MKFNTWIEHTGPKVIAKALKVDPSTVSLWRLGKSLPRPKHMISIFRMSKGQVTFDEMIRHAVKRSK